MSKLNFTNIFSKMNKVNINRKLSNIERTSNKNMFSVQNKKNITDRYVPGSSENKSMFESMMKDEKYDLIDVARKIAKGKGVTPKEREYLAEKSPTLYRQAVLASERRDFYEKKLRNSKTKKELDSAINQAISEMSSSASASSRPENNSAPELISIAINEALNKYKNNEKRKNPLDDKFGIKVVKNNKDIVILSKNSDNE